MNLDEFISNLKKCLQEPKPGMPAQLLMSPRPRAGRKPLTVAEVSFRKAGVLLLLYPIQEKLHLALTVRTEDVDHHKGQISFPGGQQEDGEDLSQTALREAREEIGIQLDSKAILGALTPLYIPPSDFCIFPIVVFSNKQPVFHPAPEEVAKILEIPLKHLQQSENCREEIWTIRGEKRIVPYYHYEDHQIWGATAMVLSEFFSICHTFK